MADIRDPAEQFFPSDVEAQAVTLERRLRTKLGDSRPWSRGEMKAMAMLVRLMKDYGLLDALLRAAEE